MNMLLLSLLWVLIGLLLGGLANGAKLRPASWGKQGWRVMLGIGWLATWLVGIQFSTVTVLWVTVVVLWVGSWVLKLRNQWDVQGHNNLS
jgi:hypothetical protein